MLAEPIQSLSGAQRSSQFEPTALQTYRTHLSFCVCDLKEVISSIIKAALSGLSYPTQSLTDEVVAGILQLLMSSFNCRC